MQMDYQVDENSYVKKLHCLQISQYRRIPKVRVGPLKFKLNGRALVNKSKRSDGVIERHVKNLLYR